MEPLEEYRPDIEVHVDHYRHMGKHLKEIASTLRATFQALIVATVALVYIAWKLA